MPITSTTSLYCREHYLVARWTDLGPPNLGAVINIYSGEDNTFSSCLAIFLDDVEYAKQLAATINSVAPQPIELEEEISQ